MVGLYDMKQFDLVEADLQAGPERESPLGVGDRKSLGIGSFRLVR
jgi:hypothetical protein